MFIMSIIGSKTMVNYTPMVLKDVKKKHFINKYNAELIKEEFGQNLLINDNFANFFIIKIFQKKGVLINNILKYLNESIFVESPIAKEKILFECLI